MATRTRDLTDQVSGFTTEFSTGEEYLPDSLEVYLNGVRQRRGAFFAESGFQSFTTTEAPRLGDALTVQFEAPGPGEALVYPVIAASGIEPGRH